MKTLIRFFLRNVPRTTLQRFAGISGKILELFLQGDGVSCPICGKNFRSFLPYGYVTSRSNALCPHCLSLERHRLVWLFLKNETDFFTRPAKTLHLAPESCFVKPFRQLHKENYVTADLESPWADVKMDVQNIPFPGGTFDVVICNHLLEHVTEDRLALRELFRVLKPGGWALLQSPVESERNSTYEDPSITRPEEREKHFGQKDHVRIYGNDYPDRIREAGFVVEPLDYTLKLGFSLAERHALPKNELIYLACKP